MLNKCESKFNTRIPDANNLLGPLANSIALTQPVCPLSSAVYSRPRRKGPLMELVSDGPESS